jgi:hypothetical protein
LRHLPPMDTPGTIYFEAANGDVREVLADRADANWCTFLRARAEDMAGGAHMLIQCVGSQIEPDGSVLASARLTLRLLQEIAQELADSGVLDQTVLDNYVFPVYARTVGEARRPLEEEADLVEAFEILEVSTAPVPSPYEREYEASGDAEAYADSYGGFIRGFTESSLVAGLFGPGTEGDPLALAERFYARLGQRLEDEPGSHPFEDWTLTIHIRRH